MPLISSINQSYDTPINTSFRLTATNLSGTDFSLAIDSDKKTISRRILQNSSIPHQGEFKNFQGLEHIDTILVEGNTQIRSVKKIGADLYQLEDLEGGSYEAQNPEFTILQLKLPSLQMKSTLKMIQLSLVGDCHFSRTNRDYIRVLRELKNDAENKNFARMVVSLDGRLLKHLISFQDDLDIVITAIDQTSDAYEFASHALRSNKNLALRTVTNDEFHRSVPLLDWVSDELKEDHEVILASIKSDFFNITRVPSHLKQNKAFIREALKANSSIAKLVRNDWQHDEEMKNLLLEYQKSEKKLHWNSRV